MDFISDLNPEQTPAREQAVLHADGPLLVLAGAGSGKTRVIACRAARLIADGLAEPDELLAVTFTNKAAEEMRERVKSLAGTGARRPWICTFHALCARILRREGGVRVGRDFVIYDSADQSAAMKRILRDLDVDDKLLSARQALAEISEAKNHMRSPASLRGESWSARGDLLAKAYERYRRALEAANALDFDDLLLETTRLFETASRCGAGTASASGSSWWTSTRTPTRRSSASSDSSPASTATCAWWAIPTSRSTSGGAPT